MAQNQNSTIEGYYAAINWLFANRPHMVEYVTSLGAPKNDLRCDRAMVVSEPGGTPRLYVNDEFLKDIGPAQAAGVLAHEWRHVLLGHLEESMNPKKQWSHRLALRDTHEVVINDSLELTGYELPDDVVNGENRGGHFYGYWGTDEAYPLVEEWYLSQPQPPESEQSDSEDEQQDGAQGSGSAGAPGSGSSQGSPDAQPGSGNGAPGEPQPDQDSSEGSDSSDGADESQDQGSGADSANSDQQDAENADGDEAQQADGSDAEDQPGAGSAEDSEEDSSEDGSLDSHCGHGVFREDENGELREMDEHELEDFIDRLNEIVAGTVRSTPMPEDEKPSEAELDAMDQEVAAAIDPSRKNSFNRAGTAASSVQQILAGGKLQLGWLKLLQRINPEVGKESGGLNAKASYNWARPRRTTSLIRGAMLPSAGAPRGRGVGTKQKPVALVALDFSASVDKKLAFALRDMAQSIPEEHIDARCFTFSVQAIPFDFREKLTRTPGGGTDFSCIEREARKIQKETGEYPYVLCLTDGEAWFDSWDSSTGGKMAPTERHLADRWLWIDIETESDERAFKSAKSYPQVKAQTNKVALPYDRSKL